MRIGPNARTAKACIAALAMMAAAQPVAAAAGGGPVSVYYERALVLAADARCGLFEPSVRTALTAAERQARGAALRAGVAETELSAAGERAARRAGGVACDDAGLRQVQGRVASAFSGWARTPRMTFPGARADWRADRTARAEPGWRLRQDGRVGASDVTFGYAAGDAPVVAVSFIGRSRPYAARVVMRDPERSPRAWLAGDRAAPPAALTRTVWATGFAAAPQGLLAANRQGELWSFPEHLAAALERLDPRESFTVEFVFRDDSTARVVFEAGDFAAGRAFLALGSL